MAIRLGTRSQARLSTCHPDLRRVIERAAELAPPDLDFTVLEGVRTYAQQQHYVRIGASKTLKSRHLAHPIDALSRAVDIAPYVNGQVSWAWPLYYRLQRIVKLAARQLGVPIEWGGDWIRFKDGPHWQLPWKDYP